LERASKNIPIDSIKSEEVFAYAKAVFKDEISPLEWAIHHLSDRLIVLAN
jgi:hypothetical protein